MIDARKFLLLSALFLFSFHAQAQFQADTNWLRNQPVDLSASLHQKKWSWGLSFTQGFTTVEDPAFPDYFVKPSMGGGLVGYYSPFPLISLGVGYAHQQHGAGILMPDRVSGVGNGDSTHRTRFRMNTWSVPISLTARTPVLWDNTRLSASAGLVHNRLVRATQVYLSIEDGFHTYTERTDDIESSFWEQFYSAGVEIEVPRSAILQIHYVVSNSRSNVYRSEGYFAGREGRLLAHGIRLTTRF